MQEHIICENDNNRRLDKYLTGLLPKAGFGFLQKMMRKKNITLNGKKAHGADIIKTGDVIRLYFAEDTYALLKDERGNSDSFEEAAKIAWEGIHVVYEDQEMLVINKPFGTLSQKSLPEDVSVNEIARAYLIKKGELTKDSFVAFRPSIVNRLDRNTGGLIIVAKTRPAAVRLSDDISNKRLRRIYLALTEGDFRAGKQSGNSSDNGENGSVIEAYYKKDHKNNIACIFSEEGKDRSLIKTKFNKLCCNEKISLIEAELLTGKSHQIRAMCAYLGHPILNDEKYGSGFNNNGGFILPGQYLFAKRIIMPDGKIIETAVPDAFFRLAENRGLSIADMEFAGA